MYIFEIIAERRIQEAIERGDFDNLPLKGKPLPKDNLDTVPDDLRIAYKILKNANIIPEELELKKRINSIQELIQSCENEGDRLALQQELNDKTLRYSIIMERRLGRSIDPRYYDKVMNKIRK